MGCTSSKPLDDDAGTGTLRPQEPSDLINREFITLKLRNNIILKPILESWDQSDLNELITQVNSICLKKSDKLLSQGDVSVYSESHFYEHVH